MSLETHGLLNLFDVLKFIAITIVFDAHIVPYLVSGNPCRLAPVSFGQSSLVFEHFLAFWHTYMF